MTLELNEEKNEHTALLRLLDMAVKANGLAAANDALFFARKVQEQMPQPEQAEEPQE